MNITSVCNSSICVGCGGCVSLCPANCIKMSYNMAGFLRAYINEKECYNCGKCVNVCPQLSSSNVDINSEKYEGFITYANNPEIRQQGQSGGSVTAILAFLLDKKKVEGVIVNKYNQEKHVNEPYYIENMIIVAD